VVVLPDTQFYSCAYPEIFEQQTQWILDHREDRKIALVLHTGDIVDQDIAEQWEVAAQSMHALDGIVPYLLVSGNHDLSASRGSLLANYFRIGDLATKDVVPVSRDEIRVDNSYAIVKLSGRRWLFIGLEFAPRDAVVAWAADVLAAHADLPAVLFTHAYLFSDGTRYNREVQPRQLYHPDQYQVTPDEGINDGEDLWRKLVEPNENVRLVLCAHVIPQETAHTTVTRASGTHVHEVLANYQLCDRCPCAEVEGGNGYLRILKFDQSTKQIRVSTYSPHQDAALTDSENQFALDIDDL
jgi:3',5'-cyclic AMP phosphodiesterase CpdA